MATLCHQHTHMVPTQPHTSPIQSPSLLAQPQAITQPCMVHKLLTTPDMPMSTLWQTTVYMCLAIAHGTCTATASDIPIYPWHCSTTCPATGKYDSNTPATYILVMAPYIITHLLTCTYPPLLMQPPPVTCTLPPLPHSHW
jgi:hypothetical protein